MDHATAQDWLDRYVAAWKSYDARSIGALFADEVAYRYHPWDDAIVGRDAVVASWLGESDQPGASTPDVVGTYDGSYAPVAVDGDVVVAIGRSEYRDEPAGPVTRVFANCFVVTFDAAGRCCDFTEYYARQP